MRECGRTSETVRLEQPSSRFHYQFTCWNSKGEIVLHTSNRAGIFKARSAYFRVNGTGKVFRVLSKNHTEEVPAEAIQWWSIALESR